jgi:seryl-tRNA synthetase
VALSFGGREAQYSALIAADVLNRAEYPRAFPHLLLSAARYHSSDVAARQPPTKRAATMWCLSPAVCYHTYAQLAGTALPEPMVLTARGTCFRHERRCSPGIRQVEFAMREVVLLGPARWVLESADTIARAIESLARELRLDGHWRVATDPFFLAAARGKAALQRLTKAKHEYQLRGNTKLAIASVNRHGTFFSQRFQITAVDGARVHSACIAVGLDRWSHAARPAGLEEPGVSYAGQEVWP